jgi:dTDP-3-amino-2,3,6-trideoxy-4-keto-D-glucose/dTDP-3-amino-3,4,6-trideoxy-alpha-D-glucose/dTDP-2,6-dideoxy-D-kanosamine transaminase
MNYLQEQYKRDKKYRIRHNYLSEQFSDLRAVLRDIEKVVRDNSFTLGEEVRVFEDRFGRKTDSKYALSVNSGTDALMLSLKAIGVEEGDEIIAPSFTFYATISAIVAAGARPVFADVKADFNIDPESIEKQITGKTRAIIPVHWAGRICDMPKIMRLASKYKLKVIEDACHAYMAKLDGEYAGNFGDIGCFSLHPLKNINVWGDGGMIVTNNSEYFRKISLLRNHGLISRDRLEIFGFNSRLDTVQAVVGKHFMKKLDHIIKMRIRNACYLDKKLEGLDELEIPVRSKNKVETFQLFSFLCTKRNKLKEYLNHQGIDAKVHYPIPMHLQKPAKKWGYKKGDFPMSEYVANHTLSLPVHEFVKKDDLDFMIDQIHTFYSHNS